jgi:hypothetical protein
MARSTLKPPAALRAITAAVAVVVLTAGPAWARPGPSADIKTHSVPVGCQAAELRISVPAAIKGDPDEGMGKRAWNIVFRNISGAACTLSGWPQIAIHSAAGKTVAAVVSNVEYSNLALVPDQEIVLPPGHDAIVTAMSPAAPAGCVVRWTLGLTLPGEASPVTVRESAGPFVPCLGGQLSLSPFYSEQTLTRDIGALSVSVAPPPFAADAAAEPATCTTAALRADVASVAIEHDGSIIEIRLSNAGAACVLPEGWPTVRLRMAGGASEVAKIFADTQAVRAGRSLLTTYDRGGTALTLQPGGSVSVALFAAAAGSSACGRVTSLVVYPTASARGAGRVARLTSAVRICGPPRVLSFLPSGGDKVLTIARGALATAEPGSAAPPAGDGFYYGTDSSAPQACGKGPYTEPSGDCDSTAGPYGEYIGEVGSFLNWKSCTTAGLAWNQSNYTMATDNVVDYSTGLGAAAYWFAAGPGRDPHYNGTASEAMTWGQEQAEQALNDMSGKVFDFRYVFMDIENNGTPPDEDGWNTVWNGACGDNVKASYIPASIDYATWQGFANYIDNHSPYLAGVYSSGGDWYGSWVGIFGSEHLPSTAEWTFTNEQTELNFPSGFSGSHAKAQWFGSAPAACDLLWQWSGGNGVLNSYGDFDQAEVANDANPSCAPTAQDPLFTNHELSSERAAVRAQIHVHALSRGVAPDSAMPGSEVDHCHPYHHDHRTEPVVAVGMVPVDAPAPQQAHHDEHPAVGGVDAAEVGRSLECWDYPVKDQDGRARQPHRPR